MAEESEMAAEEGEGLQVRRLSEELDITREEAGELKRMFEASAEMGHGFKMATSSRMLTACATVFLAEKLFYPEAPGRVKAGISSTAMALFVFYQAWDSRSNRRLFVGRGSELAENVRGLMRRLDAVEDGLEGAAGQHLLTRCEELRGCIGAFPDIGGSWSQLFFDTMQAGLMVFGLLFLSALVFKVLL